MLKIRHTKTFSNSFFGEHPYKYSLFSLSKMLSDYKVKNAGIRLNKDELEALGVPFKSQML